MELKELKPRKALNKAFLKVKPNRAAIESFKTNLIQLLDRTNDTESEEFHKNLVIDFLKKTYYDPNHFINTKGRNDLVIHNGNTATSPVAVIVEAKKPTNRAEMITTKKLNCKAFQELVLYYLRERITHKNLEVKYLIATNINEWFIFDATIFDRLFAQNKNFVKQFADFEAGRLADTKTDLFYKQIAEPFIADIATEIAFTYFDLQDYQQPLRNDNKADDNKLIALYKLLSAEHLLKLPFTNDSNSLDKRFYSELLHIIGLQETKDGGKKLIERNKEGERNSGSMLEDAIIQLDSLDKINRLDKPSQFGATQQARLFNVGLELSITWINRILFLKLLEAQLITYNKGNKAYSFLNGDKIKNFDDLNSLFFQVLARRHEDRNDDVKKAFEKVPYLNSSLFEPTEIEQVTLFISNLKDDKALPILPGTVLKNEQGKKRTGSLTTLQYLFEFLDAYDFASEGSEDIQEDNKSLINASVLGLIFEKINGYKDGSFFTPGFITMYMCRETIRKAVVQKFNETKEWQCTTIEDLYDKIDDRKEANSIVNSIKICDPAVGSGHFLVSALNEMIAVKNDLKILQDRSGKRLKEYQVEVVNDELIVTDEEGELFEYNPTNKEAQRIQETLFHEKQTIIENCLFGVDINPNSVKICRLRLWIELLKNAYYKNDTALETLPNIDINIKCGNSLVSRFAIDADLSQALKKSKFTIDSYRIAVDTYRNAESKEQKREMEKLINSIKTDFVSELSFRNKEAKNVVKYRGLVVKIATDINNRIAFGEKVLPKLYKDLETATINKEKAEAEISQIESNKIYENAFEWRFEFPEVLNDEGDFIGFDVVIGNPPYISLTTIKEDSKSLAQLGFKSFDKNGDLYVLFCEKGNLILKENGTLSFIIPNKWLNASYGKNLRNYFREATNPVKVIDFEKVLIFDEAVVFVCIIEWEKTSYLNNLRGIKVNTRVNLVELQDLFDNESVLIEVFGSKEWSIASNEYGFINKKIETKGTLLKDWQELNFFRGVTTGYNDAFHITKDKKIEIEELDKNASNIIYPLLRGKDIKRYSINDPQLYLIFTQKDSIQIDDFPGVKNHLSKFKTDLNPKTDVNDNQGRKPGNYNWFEIQDNTAYYPEFSKEKIIWIEISDKANYTLDDNGFFLTNSAYFISGKNLKYLLAVLNSKVCDFYFFQKTAKIAGGRKRYTKQYVEQNPIPIISEVEQKPYVDLVDKILNSKELNKDTTDLENQIDQLVYKLYDLTEDEIKIVEGV